MPRTTVIIFAVLAAASSALADPIAVTNTTKRPYRSDKIYCNDAMALPSQGENIACYNHDACYADPQGKSRKQCDDNFLRDLRLAGLSVLGYVKYQAVRSWGGASWERSRAKDRRQAAG